jgi:hypothetical protein
MNRDANREFDCEEPCTIANLVREASARITRQEDYIECLEKNGEHSLLECERGNLRLMQEAQQIRVLLLSTREQASLLGND